MCSLKEKSHLFISCFTAMWLVIFMYVCLSVYMSVDTCTRTWGQTRALDDLPLTLLSSIPVGVGSLLARLDATGPRGAPLCPLLTARDTGILQGIQLASALWFPCSEIWQAVIVYLLSYLQLPTTSFVGVSMFYKIRLYLGPHIIMRG